MTKPLAITGLTLQVPGRVLFTGLDVQVDAGQAVAIVGPSGAGKSSLLYATIGLFPVAAGTIAVCGEQVTGASGKQVRRVRQSYVGMVFQDARLLDGLTAAENVALPARVAGVATDEANRQARDLLQQLGVAADTQAQVLSGGEAQRAALARALVNSPRLLLADEPTGSLNAELRDEVADVLFDQPRQRDCGLVVVTHDPAVAARADHIIELVPH